MLVTMAIFDAFGAGREYVQPAFLEQNGMDAGYIQHPKWDGLKPGNYTDDTQMALALAELMLSKSPDTWTAFDVADTFVHTFRRDPREGYAGGFYNILNHLKDASDPAFRFLNTVIPNSEKNGGAMRAGPIGLLPDIKMVIQAAFFQATLTHATPRGTGAAVASALMAHYFYHDLGPKEDLTNFLVNYVPQFDWDIPWEDRVRSPADQAVRAAATAISQSNSLIDVLRKSVAFGGDVDTVAAIAGFAAALSPEIDQVLPKKLVDKLENGKYGKDYLTEIDRKLRAQFPAKAMVPRAVPADSLLS